ncbi:GNAT family N-acetyltransferase [Candidatus Falkowbacteria bacterium]|jgi:GNAT superfamily N-acetyltransferase|nr:GNAT family N-acetyltransferase [Candidatus Falkowbacteria bacterium]
MMKIFTPDRKNYSEIVDLINESDSIFFNIYTERELEEIHVADFTIEDLILGEKSREYIVLAEDDRIVSFVSFRLKNDQTIWISSLYVDKKEQKKGYGSRLLKEVEKVALKREVSTVVLETAEKAKWAVNFYLKNGYQILSVHDLKLFPYDKVIDKTPAPNRFIFGKKIFV